MIINYTKQNNIAIITMQSAPVNSLGIDLRKAILKHFQEALADNTVKAIILTSDQKVFCGGADISEFGQGQAMADPNLPNLCTQLEESPKIIVAAINGLALGGGCELALVCDYRIIKHNAAMGLPEITLGILPGAGGTQRLPRLIGAEPALDMILSGKPRSAKELLKLGAVDAVADESLDFAQATLNYTQELIERNAEVRSCATLTVSQRSAVDKDFFDNKRQQIAKQSRGLYAPECCIQAVEGAHNLDLAKGLILENKLFMDCMQTPQARGMQHLFFAQRIASKVDGIDSAAVAHAKNNPIKSVAIIGAGTMGAGIAMNFISNGIPTTILELKQDALARGLANIEKNYQSSVKKNRISQAQLEGFIKSIKTTTQYQDLADVDLVIEAAFEDLEVKKTIFKDLDTHCKPQALLASNTSTLDINAIAAVTNRPESVMGMHFFSPANIMRLLEIVRADKTSDQALMMALQLAKAIKKTPIVSGMAWGFIGNRMLEPYGREACRMILEGATVVQIDKVMNEFGLAMGLPSMIDLAGIDIGYLIRQGKPEHFYGRDPSYSAIADKLYELGRYGQKTGRGFYIYEGRERKEDPEIQTLASALAEQYHIKQRTISDEEIFERSIYTLINEGAKVLEEKIAMRASDIDVAYCFGYGFPAYRGGPMHYANEIGTDIVLARMRHYQKALGDYGALWLQPAKLLTQLGEAKLKF